MKRLTYESGILKNDCMESGKNHLFDGVYSKDILEEAISKLTDYEDTELSPAEIIKLREESDKMLKMACDECNRQVKRAETAEYENKVLRESLKIKQQEYTAQVKINKAHIANAIEDGKQLTALRAENKRLEKALERKTCILEEHDMGYSDTAWQCSACGEEWVFLEGTPKENNYKHCCKCGAKINEYNPIVYENDDESESADDEFVKSVGI